MEIMDISFNRILDEGFKKLIFALEYNQNITSLYLKNNEITRQGLESVKYILPNTNLVCIDMSYNAIKNKGVEALLNLVK
jgi:hypothetical protein